MKLKKTKRATRRTGSSTPIRCDYNNLLAAALGSRQGVTEKELDKLLPLVERYHEETIAERKSGKQDFRQLPYDRKTLKAVTQKADELKRRFENLVVLGIGGSALGITALSSALTHPHYNELPRSQRKGPRLYVMDNVDPVRLAQLFEFIDVKKTLFNVITKSGATAETLTQFLIVRNMLEKRLGSTYGEHLIATTDPEKGALRQLAEEEGWQSFPIPPGVGGRFSVLSPVGLFPAAMVGIDVSALLAGARAMDKRCSVSDIRQNPAYLGAALLYLLHVKKGKSITVMMPYAHALRDLADWFRQLWAESLGKRKSLTGKVVNVGLTPIKALGVTDQHSQVQLYMEGPCDKVIIFLAVERFDGDVNIPRLYGKMEALSYLGGHSVEELFQWERLATTWALTEARRPNATITLPRISARTIGQYIYLMEVITAFMGKLYRINPFDQPGVERGKQMTYALMGRKGYEALRDKLESRGARNPEWVL